MFLTLSAQANAWSATRKMKKVVRFPKNLVTSPSRLICDSKRGEPGIISDQYTFHLVHLFAQNSSTSMIVLPVFYRFWVWNCSGHQKTKTQGKNLQGLEFTSIDSYFKNRFEITRLWTGERIGWRKKKFYEEYALGAYCCLPDIQKEIMSHGKQWTVLQNFFFFLVRTSVPAYDSNKVSYKFRLTQLTQKIILWKICLPFSSIYVAIKERDKPKETETSRGREMRTDIRRISFTFLRGFTFLRWEG